MDFRRIKTEETGITYFWVMNVKKTAWKSYLFWILLTEAVGVLSALLTREGSELYQTAIQKPPLSPAPIVFPIVWAILYLLMGISAARIWQTAPSVERTHALKLYALQLIFNFFWSVIFFNAEAFLAALIWLIVLWVLILLMVLSMRKLVPWAGWLQVPYLVWVLFAAYLNAGVWILNR